MRKPIALLIATVVTLFVVIAAPWQQSNAKEGKDPKAKPVIQDEPGARCTRISWPKEKKRPAGEAGPGSRCSRLWDARRKGKFLPNTAAKLGLSSSTSYLSAGAPAQVTLKAVACDLDGDSLLYTFSTTGGRVAGEGANAVWDLSGAAPGTYTVSVEVDDGCGCLTFVSSVVTVAN